MPGNGLRPAVLSRMHDLLARRVESGAVPGLVAMVGRHGQVHVEVMGTLAAGGAAPVRRDAIFRMASATKPVTAAAAMVLVEECRLRLDEPVDPWLPELAGRRALRRIDAELDDTVPARRPITLRDLLTLTFGFGAVLAPPGTTYPIQRAVSELGIGGDGTVAQPDADEWISRLGTLPLMYQPGERFLYHTGADVLGILVGRAAGCPFDAFVRERILDPLGMKDTGFHVPPEKVDRFATSYAHDPATGGLAVWDDPVGGIYSRPPRFARGGNGLVSTVDDYHAFFTMLLNKGRHGSRRVLSRPSVELMTTNHLTPAQTAAMEGDFATQDQNIWGYFGKQGGWGFGMAVRTHRRDLASAGQFGWDGGLGTTAYADPDGQLVGILLTQVAMDTPDTPRLVQDFWTTAYQALEG